MSTLISDSLNAVAINNQFSAESIALSSTIGIIIPFDILPGTELSTPKEINNLREGDNPVSLHIRSMPPPKEITESIKDWLLQLKKENISILWNTSALLSYHLHLYSIEHGLKPTVAAVAKHADLDCSTLSSHLRKPQAFMSRTWLKFRNALGISSEDEKCIVDLRLLGLPPDTVQELKKDIQKVIAAVLNTDLKHLEEHARGKKLIGSQVIELFMTVHPEFADSTDTRLATLVYETLDELGIEDPRRPLIEEIAQLGATLKHTHDSVILNVMRHQKIGDMAEQFADLALQLLGLRTISEYALTTVRDGLGVVRKAGDIIDFIGYSPDNADNLRKAHLERESIRNSRVKKMTEQTVAYYEPHNESVPPWLEDQILGVITKKTRGPVSCSYAEYEDTAHGGKARAVVKHYRYEFGVDAQIYGKHIVGELMADMLEKLAQQTDRKQAAFDKGYWCEGFEIKKAGSRNIDHIIEQLKGQRDAVYKLRESDPESIGASISQITVVAVNYNEKLQEAILKLNREDNFFDYQNINELYRRFGKDLDKRMENCTLNEAVLFEQFLSKVNLLLASEPTLRTEREMYSLFPAIFSPEAVTDAQTEPESKHTPRIIERTREMMEEFFSLATSSQREITEGDLRSLFAKHFPEVDFDATPKHSRLIVHQDIIAAGGERKIVSYPRPLNNLLANMRLNELERGRFENLLEQVRRVAKDHLGNENILDLSDPEALESFLLDLRDTLRQREELVDREQAAEKQFLTRLFQTRDVVTIDGKKLANLQTIAAYNSCRHSGLVAEARNEFLGTALDPDKQMFESLIIKSMLARYKKADDNDTSEIREWNIPAKAQAYYSPSWEWNSKELESGRKQISGDLYSSKFKSAFRPLLLEIVRYSRERNKHSVTASPPLQNWLKTLVAIKDEFPGIAGSSAFYIGHFEFGKSVLNPKPINISSYANALERQKELMDPLMNGLFPEIETGGDSFEKMKAAVQRTISMVSLDNSKPLRVALEGEANMHEEKVLSAFCTCIVKNAALLETIDSELAADYIALNVKSLFNFPDVYEDHFFPAFRSVQELLSESENSASALEYLSWLEAHEGYGLMPYGKSLLKRLAILSLRTVNLQNEEFEPSPELRSFFDLIKRREFEKAAELEKLHAGTMQQALNSIYKAQKGDPHLYFEGLQRKRHYTWFRIVIDADKSDYDEYDRKVSERFSELTQGLAETSEHRKLLRFVHLKEKREADLKKAMRTFYELSANVFQRSPEIFGEQYSRFFNPQAYMGFKEYNSIKSALNEVLKIDRRIIELMLAFPKEMLDYCGHKRGPRFQRELESQ